MSDDEQLKRWVFVGCFASLFSVSYFVDHDRLMIIAVCVGVAFPLYARLAAAQDSIVSYEEELRRLRILAVLYVLLLSVIELVMLETEQKAPAQIAVSLLIANASLFIWKNEKGRDGNDDSPFGRGNIRRINGNEERQTNTSATLSFEAPSQVVTDPKLDTPNVKKMNGNATHNI